MPTPISQTIHDQLIGLNVYKFLNRSGFKSQPMATEKGLHVVLTKGKKINTISVEYDEGNDTYNVKLHEAGKQIADLTDVYAEDLPSVIIDGFKIEQVII